MAGQTLPPAMAVSESFLDFVLDQLRGLGGVGARRMFGGVGLYRRGAFFGILHRDTLFFKVGESNREEYVKAGMEPFRPFAGRPTTLRYYQVPASVLENRVRLAEWAGRSLAVESGKRRRPARAARPRRR